MTRFYQCQLRHADGGRTIAWVEEHGAKVGASVADGGEFWTVEEVYHPPVYSPPDQPPFERA